MKKIILKNKAIIYFIIFSMMSIYGFFPPVVNAASLIDVSDTISTSRPSGTATHTIEFQLVTALTANQTINITFPAGFTGLNVANVDCPTNSTENVAGQVVTCTVDPGQTLPATVDTAVVVTGVVSPAKVAAEGIADTYQIYIETQNETMGVIERADAMVAIIDQVIMTASVEATLEFTISGLAAGAVINGITTTAATTATTTPFGTLSTTGSTTLGQLLNVETNATDGYVVTVEQDHEMLSNSGDNINSFNNAPDGSGSTTPVAWTAPTNILDQYQTYGHMGLTSADQDLGGTFRNFGSGIFNGSLYAGLNGTDPMAIMSHDGPSDGITASIGSSTVAYTAEIKNLQEAGDYTSTLTYICTPTY